MSDTCGPRLNRGEIEQLAGIVQPELTLPRLNIFMNTNNCMIHSIFSIPILQTSMGSEQHQELKSTCLSLMSEHQSTDDGRFISHYFDHGKSLLEHLPDDYFENWLKNQMLIYIQDVLGTRIDSELYISECWINSCHGGGSMNIHQHTNSYVSGCYYLQFDQVIHEPLHFYKDVSNSYPGISLPVDNYNEYTTDVYTPQIIEGDMLLWQSNVKHGYSNNSEDGRITICFNAIPTRLTNESGYTINILPKSSSS